MLLLYRLYIIHVTMFTRMFYSITVIVIVIIMTRLSLSEHYSGTSITIVPHTLLHTLLHAFVY